MLNQILLLQLVKEVTKNNHAFYNHNKSINFEYTKIKSSYYEDIEFSEYYWNGFELNEYFIKLDRVSHHPMRVDLFLSVVLNKNSIDPKHLQNFGLW